MACKLRHTHTHTCAHTHAYIKQPRLSKVDSAVLFIKANSQHHIHTFVDRIFITKRKKSGYYCRLRSNLCLYRVHVRCATRHWVTYTRKSLPFCISFFLCHCHPIVCCAYCQKKKIFWTSTKNYAVRFRVLLAHLESTIGQCLLFSVIRM